KPGRLSIRQPVTTSTIAPNVRITGKDVPMRIGRWIWICLAALMMGQVCLAADESASLDDRLAQLEKEIAELKKTPTSAPAAAADSKKKGLFSSVDVQLYGYLKADVSR